MSESRRMLSSQITDELKLVAHPVGISVLLAFLSMCLKKTRERSTSSTGVVDALLERLYTLLRLMVGKEFTTERLADRVQDFLPIYLLHVGPSNTVPVDDINVTVLLSGSQSVTGYGRLY
jgi:hypothetical protein